MAAQTTFEDWTNWYRDCLRWLGEVIGVPNPKAMLSRNGNLLQDLYEEGYEPESAAEVIYLYRRH